MPIVLSFTARTIDFNFDFVLVYGQGCIRFHCKITTSWEFFCLLFLLYHCKVYYWMCDAMRRHTRCIFLSPISHIENLKWSWALFSIAAILGFIALELVVFLVSTNSKETTKTTNTKIPYRTSLWAQKVFAIKRYCNLYMTNSDRFYDWQDNWTNINEWKHKNNLYKYKRTASKWFNWFEKIHFYSICYTNETSDDKRTSVTFHIHLTTFQKNNHSNNLTFVFLYIVFILADNDLSTHTPKLTHKYSKNNEEL